MKRKKCVIHTKHIAVTKHYYMYSLSLSLSDIGINENSISHSLGVRAPFSGKWSKNILHTHTHALTNTNDERIIEKIAGRICMKLESSRVARENRIVIATLSSPNLPHPPHLSRKSDRKWRRKWKMRQKLLNRLFGILDASSFFQL